MKILEYEETVEEKGGKWDQVEEFQPAQNPNCSRTSIIINCWGVVGTRSRCRGKESQSLTLTHKTPSSQLKIVAETQESVVKCWNEATQGNSIHDKYNPWLTLLNPHHWNK